MATLTMSVSEWIEVPDNPRQRNTTKRAGYARRKHLKEPHAVHRFVFAAVKSGNILCKLDGHTRAYLWESGDLAEPSDGKVDVCLVEVSSLNDAAKVYSKLDSPLAVERPSDAIFGHARENKFSLKSSLLRQCQFSNQLRQADGFSQGRRGNSNDDLSRLVRRWKPELVALDSLNLSSTYSTIISVMLNAIRFDGLSVAAGFFSTLDSDGGTKTSQGMDGVEALSKHYEVRKAEGRLAGYENLYDLADRSWTAYETWKQGKRIRSLRKGQSMALRIADVSSLTPRTERELSCQ